MYLVNFDTADLISKFESFRALAYQDSAGVWTIGYGTTRINGRPVIKNMVINDIVANVLLLAELDNVIETVNTYISDKVKLNQNQVNALCSLIYNIGRPNFINSGLLHAINNGLLITENLFTAWNKARINGKLVELDGLTKRRKEEFKVYSTEI